jgi:hypothetical protein
MSDKGNKPPIKAPRHKRGGSIKGSANKATTRTRTAIASLIDQDFTLKDMQRLIAKVEQQEGAKAAFQCYTQLLDFTLPKLARVEHTGKDGEELSLKHILDNIGDTSTQRDTLPMPDMLHVEAIDVTEQD